MVRQSAWLHWILAVYLWTMAFIPLGHWNLGSNTSLISVIFRAGHSDWRMITSAGLATLTAVGFWFAYKRSSFSLASCSLVLDSFYFVGQVGAQWILYLFGARRLGIMIFAVYPTTTFLPSFGDHLAPDAMHSVMSILSVLAIASGITATLSPRKTTRVAHSTAHSARNS